MNSHGYGDDRHVLRHKHDDLPRHAHPVEPPTAPHPGEPHEFRTTCRLCGQPGYLNVSLIAPDERVTITEPEAEDE